MYLFSRLKVADDSGEEDNLDAPPRPPPVHTSGFPVPHKSQVLIRMTSELKSWKLCIPVTSEILYEMWGSTT